jgi:hypothetical protein
MAHDLTLTPIDADAVKRALSEYNSDDEPTDRSDQSIAVVEPDDFPSTITVDEHINLNITEFATLFVYRVIGILTVVFWKVSEDCKNYKPLHASSLKNYRVMNPLLYRFRALFKPGSLRQFIDLCRVKRGEVPGVPDVEWEALKLSIDRSKGLDLYEDSLDMESTLSHWFTSVCQTVSFIIRQELIELDFEKLLGLSGALMYTDSGTGVLDPQAGYIGRADLIFPDGPTGYFAGVEFKLTRDCQSNVLWYTPGAVLAQIICWLSGAIESRVGLVVCDLGMKLLYRIPRDSDDPAEPLVFDYYCYPPADEITRRSYYLPCRGAAGRQGLEELLRVVFELVKVTKHSQVISTIPETLRRSRSATRPPMTDSPRRPRSEGSDDDLPKRRRDYNDRENPTQGGLNDASSVPVNEDDDVTSYKFLAALNDGSVLEMEGYQYPTDFFDV